MHAILKQGKIQPLEQLPRYWHEGQELIVESCEPSDDPAVIKEWHDKFISLAAKIPSEDHERLVAAIAEQDRDAKERMLRDLGLDCCPAIFVENPIARRPSRWQTWDRERFHLGTERS